jgi:peptidyl-prolyl cis-trans isomerase B (cyclophilin B)
MKKIAGYLVATIVALTFVGCQKGPTFALIETDYGDIKVELYDSTPKHKENFIKLANEGFYDGTLFHRVIDGFMIQGGDPDSRDAKPGQRLGMGGPGYKVDAEIGAPHFRGTLAAARQGGAGNPLKQSSGSQFYIVDGQPQSEASLANFEKQKGIQYSQIQKDKYLSVGGTPMLDADYTVFGEVVEGMTVVDKIAQAQKDQSDRPIKDVAMTITILN